MTKVFWILVSIFFSLESSLFAQNLDNSELDDLLEGFSNEIIEIPKIKIIKPVKKKIEVSGAFTFSTAFNYHQSPPENNAIDYRGLSRARSRLDLVFDYKLSSKWQAKLEIKGLYDAIYQMQGRENYSQTILDVYEKELEFKEAYIAGTLYENLDIKIGRQTVVWGKSDTIRVTDVINPLDNREPGMTDIEDLRLPIVMTKLDYYFGKWNLSGMLIHENRRPKEAAFGSNYLPDTIYPFPANFTFSTAESDQEKSQYAIALNGRFTGWDISFYKARVIDSRWHFIEEKRVRQYGLINMQGFAANMVMNNFIFKAEAAYLDQLLYNNTTQKKARMDKMVGVEYLGFKETNLSLEIAERHLYAYEEQLLNAPDFIRENETQTALRYSRNFANETIKFNYLFSAFGNQWQDGGFQRCWINYEMANAFILSFGIVDYMSGEKIYFKTIDDHDRLFLDLKYSY